MALSSASATRRIALFAWLRAPRPSPPRCPHAGRAARPSLRRAASFAGLWLLTASCGSERPGASASSPDFLIITLDTTRADRLGFYGSESASTPRMDQLASESVVFDRAYTTAPITLPSHVSIFTGTWPARHGIRDNGLFQLAERAQTLAEVLHDEGYATGGFVSAYVLDARFGLDQGFQEYPSPSGTDDAGRPSTELRAAEVVDRLTAWLERVPATQPVLAWAHFFDPHAPYAAPEPFASRIDDPYDAEISYTDQEVGRLLDRFRQRRGDRAWIILTADHGESLGEHHEISHGVLIYDGTMRVPMLVRPPGGGEPERVPYPVSNAAIAGTVTALAGLERSRLPHASLSALVEPTGEVPADPAAPLFLETYLPLYSYRWAPMAGVVSGSRKLVRAGRSELFSLLDDPAETRDDSEREPETTRALERMLDAHLSAEPLDWDRDESLSDADLQTLRSLGYLAGSRVEAGDDLGDPRELVRALAVADRVRGCLDAVRLFEARGEPDRLPALFEKADQELEALRDIDPDGPLTQELAGRLYYRKGQRLRAREPLENAILARPRDAALHYLLAGCYRAAKQPALAELEYRKAIQLEPRSTDAYGELCQLLVQARRIGEAVGYSEQMLAALREAGVQDEILERNVAALRQRMTAAGETAIAPSEEPLDLRPERIVRER